MKKRAAKEWIIRIILLMIGLIIAHLGVTLFLLVDLGSDPFNVLIQGIFRRLDSIGLIPGLTHGRVHVAISLLIIFILLAVDRSYIKIGTLLCMIFGGPIIDFISLVLSPIIGKVSALPIRIIILALGCIILAFGMTIVIKSDAGTGPNDLVAVVVSDKTKKKFSIMRIIVDSLFVIVGWLLDGTFGIGTLICAALVGPVAGFFMPFSEKICSKAVSVI
ncbi:YczE/YyaS/YitT family protein [Butyrivibrio sp. INlla21]|uniref:YczE/YyaS/YitT family protein n=1 Tax=Butyrivibrio sp. INlla21 TaxID=1520811 RepID=UPI0008E963C2|nr:hypothetical protein [Butyrivibrio sp. INlla21]SFU55323.1 Uncharacterized membrane protein YczE [Butyrivibrio sp. INlla21]